MSHTIQQQRISIKHLRVADFASEETLCFSATVLFDGKPVAEASNDGRGGATYLRPLSRDRTSLAEAEAFAATLADYVMDDDATDDPSKRLTIAMTLDFLVDLLVEDMHSNRKLRAAFQRDIGNKALFIRQGRLVFVKGVKLKTVPDRPRLYQQIRDQFGSDIVVLNELPIEEAFALWKAHMIDREAD